HSRCHQASIFRDGGPLIGVPGAIRAARARGLGPRRAKNRGASSGPSPGSWTTSTDSVPGTAVSDDAGWEKPSARRDAGPGRFRPGGEGDRALARQRPAARAASLWRLGRDLAVDLDHLPERRAGGLPLVGSDRLLAGPPELFDAGDAPQGTLPGRADRFAG